MRLSNPDLVDQHKAESDLFRLMSKPPARLEDVFDSQAVREHIAKLIVNAIRQSERN